MFFSGDEGKAILLKYKNYNKTNHSPGTLTKVVNENRATRASIHSDPPASFTGLRKVLQMLGTQLFKVLGVLLRLAKRFTLGFIVISASLLLAKIASTKSGFWVCNWTQDELQPLIPAS
jgi:hypothetical protein